MKKLATALLVGAALFGAANASVKRPDGVIRIDGKVYEGSWAYVGDRPYVNVESFIKTVDVPRNHNTKYWYVSKDGKGNGSPFDLQVEAGTAKIPTARVGGATMMDLEAACRALKLPFHRDLRDHVFEVGQRYRDHYMHGAHMRNWNARNAPYSGNDPGMTERDDHAPEQ